MIQDASGTGPALLCVFLKVKEKCSLSFGCTHITVV